MRTLVDIWDAVVKVNPNDPKYARRDVTGDGIPETYCNIYCRELLEALSLIIPALRANDLAHWFDSGAARRVGWLECSAELARALADRAFVVVAIWYNPKGHPGHIVTMVDGEHCTQAGRVNFKRGKLSESFTPAQIAQLRWFYHR